MSHKGRFPRPKSNNNDRHHKRNVHPKPHYTDHKPRKSKIEIQNEAFDIPHLELQTSPHRARLILFNNKSLLFYNELSEQNMIATNNLLCRLWDTYHPKQINTNCGVRWSHTFHFKLIYDDAAEYVQSLSIKCADIKEIKLRAYIQHFKQHSSSYIKKHDLIEMQLYQKDLKRYEEHFKADRIDCFPKIGSIEPGYGSQNVIDKKLIFDVTDIKRTVLYLELDTNVNCTDFKMVDYASTIHTLIKDILFVAHQLIRRTNKNKTKINDKIDLNDDDWKSFFDWYEVNLTTYQKAKSTVNEAPDNSYDDEKNCESAENDKNKHSVVIRVELQVSIMNFIFYVATYAQKWWKDAQNKLVFQQWFNSYCDFINEHITNVTEEDNKKLENCGFDCRGFDCKKCTLDLAVVEKTSDNK